MVCDDHDYCYVEMPDEFSKISKRNHREKSLKAPAIIYADWECLLEKSYTEKKTNHTLSGCSMFASCSFDPRKNKLDCYKGEDCVERFCKDLREHTTEIINYDKRRNNTTN